MSHNTMRTGAIYYIEYTLTGYRKPRQAALRYLGETETQYIFDGRPEFGTCNLDKAAVTLIEERMPTIKLYAGKIRR